MHGVCTDGRVLVCQHAGCVLGKCVECCLLLPSPTSALLSKGGGGEVKGRSGEYGALWLGWPACW